MASDTEFEDLLSSATGQSAGGGPRRSSTTARLLWGLASVPGVALLLLATMAIRVRIADGRWPSRDQPDPKDLGLHNTATVLSIVASFVVGVAVPLLAIWLFAARRRSIPIGPPIVAAVGLAVVLLVLRGDPWGLGQWIAD